MNQSKSNSDRECKLKIRSLIVKKESLISPRASPPHPAMTRYLTGAGQLERWAQNLTPARLKWRAKQDGPTDRTRFATPKYPYQLS